MKDLGYGFLLPGIRHSLHDINPIGKSLILFKAKSSANVHQLKLCNKKKCFLHFDNHNFFSPKIIMKELK
jgi:hypothetical protein